MAHDPEIMTTGSSGPRTRVVTGLFALLALLVVPVFPHFVSPNEMSRWAAVVSLVNRGSLAIAPDVAALLLAAFFAGAARRFLRAAPDGTGLALAALLFGTPLLAYGLQLFSHSLVALGLFGAWVLLFPPDRSESAGRDVGAGVLLGLAVLADYPALVPAAILSLTAIRGRSPSRALRIALGALPPAVLFFSYNVAAFGGPFSLPVGFERLAAFRKLREHGAFGVGWPSPRNAFLLLLDPSKGLLVLSPILLAAAAATPAAVRRLGTRSGGTLVAVPVSLLLVYSGFPDWHGGFTVGARYLAPALPFLILPLTTAKWGPVTTALAGASTAAVALTTLVFPFVPPGFPLPWGSFAAPLLSEGLVAPNLFHLVWRPLAIVVPFALVLAAAVVATGKERLAPFLAGAFLWTAAGLVLPLLAPLSPPLVVQRGYVEEVYFTRGGALARSMPAGVPVPPRLLARKAMEETLPPSAWPF